MNEKFFGRTYKLTLTMPGGGSKVFIADSKNIGMDIKFSVSFAPSNGCREGEVSILGLSRKSMEDYIATASLTRGDAQKKMLKVKLEAGYEKTGNVPIIDGYAYYATVSTPPEMWLSMNVSEQNPVCGERYAYPCKEPTPLEEVVKGVLGNFKIGFEFKGTEKSILKNKVTFPGDLMDLRGCMDRLKEMAAWELLQAGQTVYGYDLGKKQKQKTEDFVADKAHGLLGVSGVSNVGVTVTTFLYDNNPFNIGHLVLNSEVYKGANGRYIITGKRYHGHFRGQEWYNTLTCTGKEF